jgi:hypothetical protein
MNVLAASRLAVFVAVGALPGAPVSEPQYVNSFYAVDANGNLIGLEHQTVTFHSRVRALPGYAWVKLIAEFKPGQSPVRLAANAQFVIRGRPIDAASRFELRPLKVSKDHRELVMNQAHGSIFGTSATSYPDEGAVAIQFEEYGANSYRITPNQPLAAGEYALALAGERGPVHVVPGGVRGLVSQLYCFGVDR